MKKLLFLYKLRLISLFGLLLVTVCFLVAPFWVVSATSIGGGSCLVDGNGSVLNSFVPTVITSTGNFDNPLVNIYTSSTTDTLTNLSAVTDKSLYFTMPISGRLDITMEEMNGFVPAIYFYDSTTNLMVSKHLLEEGFDRFVIDLKKDTSYRIAFDTKGLRMNIKMFFKVFHIMNNGEGAKEYSPNLLYVFGKDYDNSDLNSTLYNRDNYIRIALKQKSDVNLFKRILAPANPDTFIWPLSVYPCAQDYAANEATLLTVPGNTSLYTGCIYTFTLEPGIYYIAVGNIGSYYAFHYTLTPYTDATIDITPPLITGVSANAVYKESPTISFTDEGSGLYSAKLNGANISSGYQVSKEGTYTLKVTDKVDNSTTLQFLVDKSTPSISGVKNKATYKSKQTITFTDSLSGISHATLNNTTIASGKKVSKLGTYTLQVFDNAGNVKTITFTLDSLPTISGVKNSAIYRSTRKITFSDKDGIKKATLNGSNIRTSKYLYTSGKYTLKVTDKKNNTITIKFTIDKNKPVITGASHGRTYYKSIKLKLTDSLSGIKKATLNGISIKSGQKVTKKGFYTLKVYDKAGNSKIITFRLR